MRGDPPQAALEPASCGPATKPAHPTSPFASPSVGSMTGLPAAGTTDAEEDPGGHGNTAFCCLILKALQSPNLPRKRVQQRSHSRGEGGCEEQQHNEACSGVGGGTTSVLDPSGRRI